MASDSLSQESLDHDEFDSTDRRIQTRGVRARVTPNRDSGEGDSDRTVGDDDRESPSRAVGNRSKDKRSRPNHLLKGKSAKDRRKLREKRRSTGVVHMPSTESTGDSLDEDEETKRNTSINSETGLDDDSPQKPIENNLKKQYGSRSRNKSPSQTDLEADLEDNQDYDSTVSQSETNLTTIGQSETVFKPIRLNSAGQSQDSLKGYPSTTTTRDSSRHIDSHNRLQENHKPSSHNLPEFHRLAYTPKYKELNVPKIGGHISHSPSGFRRAAGDVNHHSNEAKLAARNKELEKLLKEEKEENKKLKETISEKDLIIQRLEHEIGLMNKDLDELDDENERLHGENKALLRVVSQVSSCSTRR